MSLPTNSDCNNYFCLLGKNSYFFFPFYISVNPLDQRTCSFFLIMSMNMLLLNNILNMLFYWSTILIWVASIWTDFVVDKYIYWDEATMMLYLNCFIWSLNTSLLVMNMGHQAENSSWLLVILHNLQLCCVCALQY